MPAKHSRSELLADLQRCRRLLCNAVARIHELEVRLLDVTAQNEQLLETIGERERERDRRLAELALAAASDAFAAARR